jgi:hypothetical protein
VVELVELGLVVVELLLGLVVVAFSDFGGAAAASVATGSAGEGEDELLLGLKSLVVAKERASRNEPGAVGTWPRILGVAAVGVTVAESCCRRLELVLVPGIDIEDLLREGERSRRRFWSIGEI